MGGPARNAQGRFPWKNDMKVEIKMEFWILLNIRFSTEACQQCQNTPLVSEDVEGAFAW